MTDDKTTRGYYGASVPRSKGPHPDPLADAFPQPRRNDGGVPCGECHIQPGETCDICGAVGPSACEVCGNEARTADGCFNCECPAPLDPDRLREDRDERRRMEKEFPYAE